MKYGFDFGTTNSSISLLLNGEPRLIPVDKKSIDPTVIRSLLFFFHRDLVKKEDKKTKKEDWVYEGEFKYTFGQDALETYLSDNRNRAPGFVRQIFTGRMVQNNISVNAGPADLVAEYYEDIDYGVGRLMQALKTALKAPLYRGSNLFGKFFTLEQMISLFVSQIKNVADKEVGGSNMSLRVGRPVKFLEDPKKDKEVESRLYESLKMVGFSDIEFEFEPVAAAKYFLHRFKLSKKKILVFDFGGGTLDTAIVEFDGKYNVIATDGVYIGGNLLNSDIMKAKLNPYFGSEIRWGDQQAELPGNFMAALNSWYAVSNLNNPSDMRALGEMKRQCSDLPALERLIYLIKMNLGFSIYEAIEKAKKDLSENEETKIQFSDGPIQIDVSLSRKEFEELINPRINEIREVVLRTLKLAKTTPEEIGVVVRTGGSSLIPKVEQMLAEIFGSDKVRLFDAFTSIAAGLALD
jgi:hypothetical chaperone protein